MVKACAKVEEQHSMPLVKVQERVVLVGLMEKVVVDDTETTIDLSAKKIDKKIAVDMKLIQEVKDHDVHVTEISKVEIVIENKGKRLN